MLEINVNDCLCIGNKRAIEKAKSDLKEHFKIKDESPVQEYVGCHVIRQNKKLLKISQC